MTDHNRLGDGPIDENVRVLMNGLAQGIDEILNDGAKGEKRKNGFILMVFPFEGHDGRCNYISSAKRDDVVALLKEQLARFEGEAETKGKA